MKKYYYCIEFKGKGLDKPDTYKFLSFESENLMHDYIIENENWDDKYWTFIQVVSPKDENIIPTRKRS
jgi:hypothetical protein